MPRRRYVWRHPLHHLYVLDSNCAVRVENHRGRDRKAPWCLTIDRQPIGTFRTFRLAEDAIPAESLRGVA